MMLLLHSINCTFGYLFVNIPKHSNDIDLVTYTVSKPSKGPAPKPNHYQNSGPSFAMPVKSVHLIFQMVLIQAIQLTCFSTNLLSK